MFGFGRYFVVICGLLLIWLPRQGQPAEPALPGLMSYRLSGPAARLNYAPGLQATQDTVTARKAGNLPDPTGAMVRSALLPGWGQFYNKKYWKAALVIAVETGIVANAVWMHQKMVKSRSETEEAYWRDRRNLNFWWLLGFRLLSMLDAYVDAHLADFDESPSVAIRPTFQPTGPMSRADWVPSLKVTLRL